MNFCLVALCVGFLISSAKAHHSRAAFDLDTSISVYGRVTEVAWTNPHYYLSLEARAGYSGVWVFEGHSIPGLVRNGWRRDTVRVGDFITVDAWPNLVPDVPFALLTSVTLSAGETYYSFQPRAGSIGANLQPTPSMELAGTWRVVRSLRANLVGVFDAPEDLPLTDAAQLVLDAYDPQDDPSLDCQSRGLPRMLEWPYAQRWAPAGSGFAVTMEHATDVRSVRTEERECEASSMGCSVGRALPDGGYEVVTTHFSPQRWGITRGVDSSTAKRLIERYRVLEGGTRLQLDYTVSDEQMLREPVQMRLFYERLAAFTFAAEPACDLSTARRHLRYDR
ncbi:MAG: DUF6152 family protein [Pseudomonadota bacterium]